MRKLNPQNERIKRAYLRYVREAKGKSEATLDAIRKALSRFEHYTGARDFKSFNREQAIGFKEWLTAPNRAAAGGPLGASTRGTTLTALRDFFCWLAWQPGFKSRIHVPDVEYLNLSMKDDAIAKAAKLRDFPSLEQIRTAIAAMPASTVLERRNRALIAFAILTGIRDRAIASLSLRHLDLAKQPPLVRQEPDRVKTKLSKFIPTYFFPLGQDLEQIVVQWAEELRTVHLFGPNDPLFPRTKVERGNSCEFSATGVEQRHWTTASSIRAVLLLPSGYTDNSSIPDLVFTYDGPDFQTSGGPYPSIINFGGLSADSIYGSRTSGYFSAEAVKNDGPDTGTAAFNVGGVDIPGVPEPATWALLILGFGMIGTMLRTARNRRAGTALGT